MSIRILRAKRGFSLIELMVVIAIVAILSHYALRSVGQLRAKQRIETATKDVYQFLVSARNEAAWKNRSHIVNFDTSNRTLTMWVDMNNNDQLDTSGQNADRLIKTLRLPNDVILELSGTGNNIIFNERGITTNNRTLRLRSSRSDVNPNLNCVVTHFIRINIGKLSGSGSNEECKHR